MDVKLMASVHSKMHSMLPVQSTASNWQSTCTCVYMHFRIIVLFMMPLGTDPAG